MENKQVMLVTKNFTFPVRIDKSYTDDNKKRYIEGLAAAPGLDRNRPCIELTEGALIQAVDDLKVNNVLFLEHDRGNPVGRIVEPRYEAGKGIVIKAIISKTADNVWQMITEGIYTGLSIGGKAIEYVEEKLDPAGTMDWDNMKKVVTKLLLMEVSVVALPGNINCRIDNYVTKAFNDNYKATDAFDIETKEVSTKKDGEKSMSVTIQEALTTANTAQVPVVETPVVAPVVETPKVEAPVVEAPKVETPVAKTETPVAPVVEAPKVDELAEIKKQLAEITEALKTITTSALTAEKVKEISTATVKEAIKGIPSAEEITKAMSTVDEIREELPKKPVKKKGLRDALTDLYKD